MKRTWLLLLALLPLLLVTCQGNPSPSPWTQTYGDEGETDSVSSVLSVSNGGFLLVGAESHYSDPEHRDVYRTFLLRTDSRGKELWKKTIGYYQSLKEILAALETDDKGFVVFETHMVFIQEEYKYELSITKTDLRGNELWSKAIETNINAYSPHVVTSGGGFIVSGASSSGTDIEAIEIDAGGTVNRRISLALPIEGSGYKGFIVKYAANGDFIVAGSKTTGERQSDIYLAKMDKEGQKLWGVTCHAPGFQLSPSHILESSDGRITVIGSAGPTVEYFRPYAEIYVTHFDADGDLLWSTTWGDETHGYEVTSIVETQDGGYLISGEKSRLAPLPGIAFLFRISGEGKELWSRTFGDATDPSYVWSMVNSMLEVSDGFIIAGEFAKFPPTPDAAGSDIFLMKIDSDGNYEPSPLHLVTPIMQEAVLIASGK